MDLNRIQQLASTIKSLQELRLKVASGQAPSPAYIPSGIRVFRPRSPDAFVSEFIPLYAPIFEKHGRQMEVEFSAVVAKELSRLEAELRGEICPQPEPDPDAYLAPVIEAFGAHKGLSADWACMAWPVADNLCDGTWLLDDEHPDETVSLVTRKDDGSVDPAIVTICQGSVEQVLPIAKAIAVQVQHG